jgi:uncharacterized protein
MDVPRESWLDPGVIVRPSAIHGLGLFAARRIRAGELVIRLGGVELSDEEVRRKIAHGERYDGIILDEHVNLQIEPADWPGIHGNHSCDPNLWLTGSVEISALRGIGASEEMTTDYATYTMTRDWSMRCSCGSPLCRGLVTGDDWRRMELQKRYAGHFARPIERHIRARQRHEISTRIE